MWRQINTQDIMMQYPPLDELINTRPRLIHPELGVFSVPPNTTTDTECYITSITTGNVDHRSTGLTSHFRSISVMPALPDTMKKVKIRGQNIKNVDILPPNLIYLKIDDNQIAKIPDELPQGLLYFDCDRNAINKLPDPLPLALCELYCSHNRLKNLPTVLPDTITIMWCDSNELTALPNTLPRDLIVLVCSDNQLSAIAPQLPPYLSVLICDFNRLVQLPTPLPPLLTHLNCSHNMLNLLPANLGNLELLEVLKCSHNKITVLPDILPPRLHELTANNNCLYILPDLPETIERLALTANALEYNYPDIYCYDTPLEQIRYINNRNWKIRKEWLEIVNAQNPILEYYMRRMMHPNRLNNLKNNPDIDVDEFMKNYVELL